MDDQAYLAPNFDPSSLTMPRLRSILVAHNVTYPASAKKQVLVDIFTTDVLPQARKLRNASARVKRTSRGIENVPSLSSSHSTADDEEEEVPVAPSTGRSTRRTTRARTEEVQEVAPTPTPRGTRHSTAPPEHTPRPASTKHARAAEAPDTERQPKRVVSRGSRWSAATPVGKDDDDDDEQDDSNFSNKNVFQSGSSPPAPRTRDPERRRTMMSAAASRDREVERRRVEVRRRTEAFQPARDQMDGAVVPTRRTFEAPIARVRAEADVEPTEEFTPEEEQELAVAQQSGEVVPARPKTRRPASSAAKTAPFAILAAMLVGLLGVYRQEKVELGYCGVGAPSTEIAGVHIPDWADAIRPQCEPCPQHAYCGEKLETTCEPGFVLTPHPLSFGGVIPLVPSCEPDSAKARKVGAVKQRAIEELREQNAKYECGEAPTREVQEPELKKAIASKRRKNMSNEEFEDLWGSALGEIQTAEEVTTGADGHGHFTLRSHSLARLPLACAIRRSLRAALGRHLRQLLALLLLLAAAASTRHHILSTRETERHAESLARDALDMLREHAARQACGEEVFVGVAQLRDDVLQGEFSAGRRARLWERVRAKVEANCNVRAVVREGRSGDVGRVWEWVGVVGGTPERGRKSVVGFGNLRRDGEGAEVEVGGVRGWEEGRAYY